MGKGGEKWKTLWISQLHQIMFIGEYQHSIDEKGRVQVPAKFRPALADGAVVTRGLDESLFLYTKAEWEKIAEKIAALPLSKASARSFSRLMLAGAMEVELDKQGRMMLPSYLRKFAGLGKGIIFAGLYTRIELWDEAKWRTYQSQMESTVPEITDDLNELGL